MRAGIVGTVLVGCALFAFSAAATATPASTDLSVTNFAPGDYQVTGSTGVVEIKISDTGTPDDATLTVKFPAGLSLGSAGLQTDAGAQLTCTATGQNRTCEIPAAKKGVFDIAVDASPSIGLGPTPGISISIAPKTLADSNPHNNSVVAPVTIVGRARLGFTMAIPSTGLSSATPSSGSIPTARQTEITCTVTNFGPDAATNPELALTVSGDNELSVAGGNSAGAWTMRASPNGPGSSNQLDVAVSTLAKGGHATVRFYVTAAVAGARATLRCYVVSAGQAQLTQPTLGPPLRSGDQLGGQLILTAVSVAPVSLANTGSNVAGLLTLGGLLLVSGVGVGLLSRRRLFARELRSGS
jgi:LPXTG-motif cell wall-anchored protein